MKFKTASIVLAAVALAAWPASYAAASNIVGWDMETLEGSGHAYNVLNPSNVDDGSAAFNANYGTSEQSNTKARFGTYSAHITGDANDGAVGANITIYSYPGFAASNKLSIMGQVNLDATNYANDRVVTTNITNNTSDHFDTVGQYRFGVDAATGSVYAEIYDATGASTGSLSAYGSYDRLVSAGGLVTLGSWAHVGMTFDNGLLTLYVDGTQVASHDYSATVSSIGNSNFPLVGDTGYGSRYLNGYLDDYYYNDTTALSAHDVAFYSTHTITDAVPEPASLGLLAMGGMLLIRRRRKV